MFNLAFSVFFTARWFNFIFLYFSHIILIVFYSKRCQFCYVLRFILVTAQWPACAGTRTSVASNCDRVYKSEEYNILAWGLDGRKGTYLLRETDMIQNEKQVSQSTSVAAILLVATLTPRRTWSGMIQILSEYSFSVHPISFCGKKVSVYAERRKKILIVGFIIA